MGGTKTQFCLGILLKVDHLEVLDGYKSIMIKHCLTWA